MRDRRSLVRFFRVTVFNTVKLGDAFLVSIEEPHAGAIWTDESERYDDSNGNTYYG